jgi:hypothetical protein
MGDRHAEEPVEEQQRDDATAALECGKGDAVVAAATVERA